MTVTQQSTPTANQTAGDNSIIAPARADNSPKPGSERKTSETSTLTMLEAAREYAINGWRVLPCRPGSKAPATKNGYKDATSDLRQIEKYWAKNPNAPIGLVPPPNTVVIDIDPRNGGSLHELFKTIGLLPYTLTCVTGSHNGGIHMYYTANPEDIKNFSAQPVKGVDVKTSKGYLLAPPSLHESGGRYEWILAPIAVLPPAATRALTRKNLRVNKPGISLNPGQDTLEPRWQTGDITGLSSQEQGYLTMCHRLAHEIGEGNRNNYLNKCAFVMGKENAPEYWRQQLYAAALASGLSSSETVATIKSGLEGGVKQ